jgi:Sec-independent protein secretion pathway component TatC
MHSPAPLPRRSEEQQEAQMGFLEHLDELRSRIITCLLAIVAGMAVAAFFAKWLTAFVMGPTLQILGGTSLVTTRLGEGFSFYFDVLLIGGSSSQRPSWATRCGASSHLGSTSTSAVSSSRSS